MDADRLARILAKLYPEHRRIVEALVRELAKLQGTEHPAEALEGEPAELSSYLQPWLNSLDTRGFSSGSIDLYR